MQRSVTVLPHLPARDWGGEDAPDVGPGRSSDLVAIGATRVEKIRSGSAKLGRITFRDSAVGTAIAVVGRAAPCQEPVRHREKGVVVVGMRGNGCLVYAVDRCPAFDRIVEDFTW